LSQDMNQYVTKLGLCLIPQKHLLKNQHNRRPYRESITENTVI
jgi:hypothetical protein